MKSTSERPILNGKPHSDDIFEVESALDWQGFQGINIDRKASRKERKVMLDRVVRINRSNQ